MHPQGETPAVVVQAQTIPYGNDIVMELGFLRSAWGSSMSARVQELPAQSLYSMTWSALQFGWLKPQVKMPGSSRYF